MGSLTALETGHIGLNVSNVQRSTQFYQQVFGFEVMGQSNDAGRQYAFLGRAGKLILTLWQQSEGRFPKQLPGLHHLSFQVGSVADVQAFEARLQSLGTPFLYDGIVPHGEGADSGGVFFEDPDGIRLEIFTASGVKEYTAPVANAPSCGFF